MHIYLDSHALSGLSAVLNAFRLIPIQWPETIFDEKFVVSPHYLWTLCFSEG